jgi:hypothetical protein
MLVLVLLRQREVVAVAVAGTTCLLKKPKKIRVLFWV